jgi:hypothetical protein
MSEPRLLLHNERTLDRLAAAIFWVAVPCGPVAMLAARAAADGVRRGLPFATAVAEQMARLETELFAPGTNLFLVMAFAALPFLVFAPFALWHLGTAFRHGAVTANRRLVAVAFAGITSLALSAWWHYEVFASGGDQRMIALFFLPPMLLAAAALAYALGRWAARRWLR